MQDFIKHIKQELASACIQKRIAANTSLLAYDLGRANTDEEMENARKEWEFRMWAFQCSYGLKDGIRVYRKFK